VSITLAVILLAAELGSVAFPTSTTNARAQAEFERGVAALHSFWYEEAAASFRRAQSLDSSLAMAYWGEAMTHNHPIWYEQDREAARAILAKAPKATTDRERDWLATLEVLYGDGDKRERDVAYERALASMRAKHPNDVEAQAFHALAILGTLRRDAEDQRRQIRAAAILEPLLVSHPDHPGVLHYMIHAYDDPLHAPLGLRAARRYSRVAPAAHHALHMPSHIFLQLGMWPEAAASNEQSFGASKAWVERDKLPSFKRDLHSLGWLQYIYLQQGRRDDAKRLLDEVIAAKFDSPRERSTRTRMLATWAVETGEPVDASTEGGADAPHCGMSTMSSSDAGWFARGYSAIKRGKSPAAALEGLAKERESKTMLVEKKTVQEMELVLRALDAQREGKLSDAIDLARKAAALEETLGAPSGPPDVIKPAYELWGELLLAAGKPAEALEQFRVSLQRTPNRALSLRGEAAARAAVGASKPAAP
jgi:tetratricopeptide (TPR) repeat protein